MARQILQKYRFDVVSQRHGRNAILGIGLQGAETRAKDRHSAGAKICRRVPRGSVHGPRTCHVVVVTHARSLLQVLLDKMGGGRCVGPSRNHRKGPPVPKDPIWAGKPDGPSRSIHHSKRFRLSVIRYRTSSSLR
jgi:hypothetical protein